MTANYTMSPSSQQVQLFLALLVAQEAFTLWVSNQSMKMKNRSARMLVRQRTKQILHTLACEFFAGKTR